MAQEASDLIVEAHVQHLNKNVRQMLIKEVGDIIAGVGGVLRFNSIVGGGGALSGSTEGRFSGLPGQEGSIVGGGSRCLALSIYISFFTPGYFIVLFIWMPAAFNRYFIVLKIAKKSEQKRKRK